MENSGVIMLMLGTRPWVRGCVALHTLRQHYSGVIQIFHDGQQPALMDALMEEVRLRPFYLTEFVTQKSEAEQRLHDEAVCMQRKYV